MSPACTHGSTFVVFLPRGKGFCLGLRGTDFLQFVPEIGSCCGQVGEGEFGTVHRAKWYGTIVAVKILRRSDAVAIGDFRCPYSFQAPCTYLHVAFVVCSLLASIMK